MLGYAARSNVRANFDRETKKQGPGIMFRNLDTAGIQALSPGLSPGIGSWNGLPATSGTGVNMLASPFGSPCDVGSCSLPDEKSLSLIAKFKEDAVAGHVDIETLAHATTLRMESQPQTASAASTPPPRTRSESTTGPSPGRRSRSSSANFDAKRIACIQCGRKDVTFGKNQRKKYGNRARCRDCTQSDKTPTQLAENQSVPLMGHALDIRGSADSGHALDIRGSAEPAPARAPSSLASVAADDNEWIVQRRGRSRHRSGGSGEASKTRRRAVGNSSGAPAPAHGKAHTQAAPKPPPKAQKSNQVTPTPSEISNEDESPSRLAFFRTLTGKDELPSWPGLGGLFPQDESKGAVGLGLGMGMGFADPDDGASSEKAEESNRFIRSFSFGDYDDEVVDDEEWARAVAEKRAAEERRRAAEASPQPHTSSISMSGSVSIRFAASPDIGTRSVGSALVAHEAATFVAKSCLDRGEPMQAIIETRYSIDALEAVLDKVVDSTGALQRALNKANKDLEELQRKYPDLPPPTGSPTRERMDDHLDLDGSHQRAQPNSPTVSQLLPNDMVSNVLNR